jgi:hypothetical protein
MLFTFNVLDRQMRRFDMTNKPRSQAKVRKRELSNDLTNIILDWMREMNYGGKDGHSPAMILTHKIMEVIK